MDKEKYSEIYNLLEESKTQLLSGFSLHNKAILKLLEATAGTDTKTENLIETLIAPGYGDIYTTEELSKILKVAKSTIYKWIQQKKIPFTKPNSGKVIFHKHQISEFLNNPKYLKCNS